MREMLLKKQDVKDLCLRASDEWETYVPLEEMGGDVQLVRVDANEKKASLDKLNLDYERLVISPKVIGFPQLEYLFEFADGRITDLARAPTKKLLFGLRACDLKAMLFVDEFFGRNFEDIYYLNRSIEKLNVLVGCKRPLRDCFCTSAKTGPFLPVRYEPGRGRASDFDLQMVDIDSAYLVEIGSRKGQEFIDSFQEFFEEASKQDVEHSATAKKAAEDAVGLKLDFEKAIQNFCEDKIPESIYEPIAERCIYCGGCLYVCPTCTCFNVFDEKQGKLGIRCRNWDACVFQGYTREASGHNPRQEKWIRTARRYEHKLKYDYLTTGMSGCVGCGRCLSSCPVNIGISQVIEKAQNI
ncbi:MAG TPA: 4Fe-4S dicluster domain-containing protein [Sedimentisphaerales bacterium]|nr:4Fe-4S dicluster domain-containing protein [Sedimentisphaerales bacterium]